MRDYFGASSREADDLYAKNAKNSSITAYNSRISGKFPTNKHQQSITINFKSKEAISYTHLAAKIKVGSCQPEALTSVTDLRIRYRN